jgi:hypothetical protein
MLAGMLAQGAAVDLRADVLTSADLRNALDLEAQKQVASYNDGASCPAEIAQALDAHVVLSGNLSSLEDEWLLQVSAYDARQASSAGRRTVRATTRKDLATAAEVAGRELVAPLLVGKSETERLRVLILDVNVTQPGAGAIATAVEAPSPYGWFSVAGGSVAGLGAVAGVFGRYWPQPRNYWLRSRCGRGGPLLMPLVDGWAGWLNGFRKQIHCTNR